MDDIFAPVSPALTQVEIDQRVFDLYDEYCHGGMDRRSFLQRAAAVTVGGWAMAQALLPRYAQAQTISFTDTRIKARYVTYPSPGSTSGTMRGYLVQPTGPGPFGAVVVIHENRGLDPYIEDVARRLATEGFLALAPDGLAPVGGYPGNDDDGRTLQSGLDQGKLRTDMANSARFLKSQPLSSGKLGVTVFAGAAAQPISWPRPWGRSYRPPCRSTAPRRTQPPFQRSRRRCGRITRRTTPTSMERGQPTRRR